MYYVNALVKFVYITVYKYIVCSFVIPGLFRKYRHSPAYTVVAFQKVGCKYIYTKESAEI
jgi:hypothetical protein